MAPSATSDNLKPRDVCIVGIARTPMGGFLGSLSSLPATKLGSIAIEGALKRSGIEPGLVQEVFFGNVLSANLGQAPARQAALGAGIPNTVVCTTVNKVCASGMKATMLAAQTIQLGINDIVVAGGMESMSNAPKYLAEARKGSRFGHDTVVDGMLKDGLWDVYNDYAMGMCAELCADQHSITREEQDNYAIQSNERGIAASNSGAFSWEIVPVEVPGGRGRPSVFMDKDESLEKFDPVKLRKLRPSFKENGGVVTAGNASSISDGAAALVLVSGERACELGLHVIAKIRGYADAAQAPELFTTAPALALPKAISNSGLDASQIDYYEINEAFTVVALANQKLLGLSSEKLNAHGGAVSLGHPLGCSGARILVTLLGVLRHRNGKFGAAGVCNGGGGASALVLELMEEETAQHILTECNLARAVWFASNSNYRIDTQNQSLEDRLLSWSKQPFIETKGDVKFIKHATSIMWNLWKNRCTTVFEHRCSTPYQLVLKINQDLESWNSHSTPELNIHPKATEKLPNLYACEVNIVVDVALKTVLDQLQASSLKRINSRWDLLRK